MRPLVLALLGIAAACATVRAVTPDEGSADSLRAAIADLTKSFGERYPKGDEFLQRLDALGSTTDPVALATLRREALLANPLLDFGKLLFIRRPAGSPRLGLPQNWQGNCSLARKGFQVDHRLTAPGEFLQKVCFS